MSGIRGWFDFRSKEEKKEQQEAYLKKVFPFGERQKNYEQDLLNQLIEAKVSPEEKMYQLLVVKECFSSDEQKRNEKLKSWRKQRLLKKYSENDKNRIAALAMLSAQAEDFSALPKKKDVELKADEIAEMMKNV